MTAECSRHYIKDREDRINFIDTYIGVGDIVDTFIVDRGHIKGVEEHDVTDTGIIIIKNYLSGKIITNIVARPKQLRELYGSEGRVPPRKLLRLAYRHNILGYNQK